MVYVALTRRYSDTFDNLFDWMPEFRSQISFIFYDDLPLGLNGLQHAPVIFADIDRLDPEHKLAAKRFADRLLLMGWPVLNHPGRFVDRYSLLVRLNNAQLNEFRAFRVPEVLFERRIRYPIFLRKNSGHSANFTALAGNRWALARQVLRQMIRATLGKVSLRNVIAVEFQSVARKEGYSAKYSYLKVGNSLLARHVIFSRSWIVKHPDLYDEDMKNEEEQFLATKPHADTINAIFNIAGIDYGRIDYSIDPNSGRLHVWEINTNPTLAARPEKTDPTRRATQRTILEQVCSALSALTQYHAE